MNWYIFTTNHKVSETNIDILAILAKTLDDAYDIAAGGLFMNPIWIVNNVTLHHIQPDSEEYRNVLKSSRENLINAGMIMVIYPSSD